MESVKQLGTEEIGVKVEMQVSDQLMPPLEDKVWTLMSKHEGFFAVYTHIIQQVWSNVSGKR